MNARFEDALDHLIREYRRGNNTDVDTILAELEAALFRLEDKPDAYDAPYFDFGETPPKPDGRGKA